LCDYLLPKAAPQAVRFADEILYTENFALPVSYAPLVIPDLMLLSKKGVIMLEKADGYAFIDKP